MYYIDARQELAAAKLSLQLKELLRETPPACRPVILCIGTDRVTGDSVGPITGTLLQSYGACKKIAVYGTLEWPVHALNLEPVYQGIQKRHPRSPILAVDASLGIKQHLEYITLGRGSLLPGAGVNKNLGAVGDFYITGIVNTPLPEAQASLSNTRLSSVMRISCCIAHGILQTFCPELERV